MSDKSYIALGMTGASGAQYGLRLLEVLLMSDKNVHLVMSDPARMVINTETPLSLPKGVRSSETLLRQHYQKGRGELRVFAKDDWFAPMASGSNPPTAMVLCPCTVGTLGAVAAGLKSLAP